MSRFLTSGILTQGSLLNYLRLFTTYKTRVETDSGTVQDDTFSKELYKIFDKYKIETNMKLSVIAEGGLKTRTSGVEKYVTKTYDLSANNNDPAQTTESSQPFLGGRIAPNEIQNFKSVTGVTKTLTHTDIVVSGTYTIIKVLNAESSGKTVVSFTEVGSGTYNSIAWTGRLYLYGIYGGTISGANQTLIETELLALIAAMESVVIGSQTWATSNLEMVATPQGNVITNITTAANVEKIVNGGFDTDTDWSKNGTATISGGTGNLTGNSTTGNYLTQNIVEIGKWYKLVYTVTANALVGTDPIYFLGLDIGGPGIAQGSTYTYYIKSSAVFFRMRTRSSCSSGTISFDNVSVEEVGWSGLGDLYTGLIAQGYTEANAVKECAAWCYYNNDSEIGAVYGKLYNWYAAKLLQNDIDAYNVANPSTPWGWHVPTQAEFDALATALGGASVAGGKMKVAGTDYWNSPNTGADNSSGFSALGVGRRTESTGAFALIKSSSYIHAINEATSSTNYLAQLTEISSTLFIISAAKERGAALRLLKD